MMTRITKKLRIEAPKQEIWNIISDLGGIQNYNPTVKSSYYNTDVKHNIGAGRICEFNPTGKVEEKAIKWNEGHGYTLHIKPVEKIPFFKEGYAIFSLESIADDATLIEVDFTYSVNTGAMAWLMNKLAIKNNFSKGFEGILMGLKKHTEEGAVIDSFSSLKGYQVSFA